MTLISNLLAHLARRDQPRLAVEWWVDIKVPETDRYVGFQTSDISLPGVRLKGETSEAFRRIIGRDGHAHMRLRIPGHQESYSVRAELKWGLGNTGSFLTGWRFAGLPRPARRKLRSFIDSHPELKVREVTEGTGVA